MATIQVNLLGGFDVVRGGVPVEGFRSDKTRALLAYLVVENGRVHQRMALANLLWSEYNEQAARTSLRATLYNLRQILDALLPAPEDGSGLFVTRQTVQFVLPAPPVLVVRRHHFRYAGRPATSFTTMLMASLATCVFCGWPI